MFPMILIILKSVLSIALQSFNYLLGVIVSKFILYNWVLLIAEEKKNNQKLLKTNDRMWHGH